MKLYIIIYIAGELAASVGPLSYGMEACERRLKEFDYGPGCAIETVTPEGHTCRDVDFRCELLPDHPDAPWVIGPPEGRR